MLDVLCVLFLTAVAATQTAVVETPHMLDDRAFERLMTAFRRRGIEDWANRWRTEKHRRCTMQLHHHMLLVCRVHDAAHTVKKWSEKPSHIEEVSPEPSRPKSDNEQDSQEVDEVRQIDPEGVGRPYNLVRKRRSLTEECCYSEDGCTWADYAEYCDTPYHRVHPRLS